MHLQTDVKSVGENTDYAAHLQKLCDREENSGNGGFHPETTIAVQTSVLVQSNRNLVHLAINYMRLWSCECCHLNI